MQDNIDYMKRIINVSGIIINIVGFFISMFFFHYGFALISFVFLFLLLFYNIFVYILCGYCRGQELLTFITLLSIKELFFHFLITFFVYTLISDFFKDQFLSHYSQYGIKKIKIQPLRETFNYATDLAYYQGCLDTYIENNNLKMYEDQLEDVANGKDVKLHKNHENLEKIDKSILQEHIETASQLLKKIKYLAQLLSNKPNNSISKIE